MSMSKEELLDQLEQLPARIKLATERVIAVQEEFGPGGGCEIPMKKFHKLILKLKMAKALLEYNRSAFDSAKSLYASLPTEIGKEVGRQCKSCEGVKDEKMKIALQKDQKGVVHIVQPPTMKPACGLDVGPLGTIGQKPPASFPICSSCFESLLEYFAIQPPRGSAKGKA